MMFVTRMPWGRSSCVYPLANGRMDFAIFRSASCYSFREPIDDVKLGLLQVIVYKVYQLNNIQWQTQLRTEDPGQG